ncbi:hypothetical protein N7462_010438 [Penicillium macrosclerotiorum]|uniref:uncharacterized protein n=1 Tax=Penicillium macrosclerotiorum TaxID=303699 RepID=UPI002548650E|nr:uncharacterized protein N7462_010438 [Penicillium macrosclerotiorum]KAJ5669368.1 hypothetical protein N7462_010438 [Penicillium macrosclerotiorum]
MSFRRLLGGIFALLFPLTLTASIYLYLYPVLNGCAFPLPQTHETNTDNSSFLGQLKQNAAVHTFLQHLGAAPATPTDNGSAIFRLLVLADPQLEGDSSLPLPDWKLIPRIRTHWRAVQEALTSASASTSFPHALLDQAVLDTIKSSAHALFVEDIPRSLRATQKQLDLLGNDYYLAHIYRTLFWWTRPTHTTVLGDLLGSQWIDDAEFAHRSERYWTRVFRDGIRVNDETTRPSAPGHKQPLEPLGASADPVWPRRIINVAGNHDIGYAGDVSPARMARFEREFGRANWDVRFAHPVDNTSVAAPTLHLINLNTLVLDTPALSEALQTDGYAYLNSLISRLYPVEDASVFTLLLTHLPLHKADGVCADGPYFTFHDADDTDAEPRWRTGGLREQNHLSDHISATGVLQGIFGMSGNEDAPVGGRGRKGLILTGHDHVGCDAVHYIDREHGDAEAGQSWSWAARRYGGREADASGTPSIREVTLRSMMGEFGGNAGLLSVWFDAQLGEWDYEIVMCPAGVQHVWWAVHVSILVTVLVGLFWVVAGFAAVGEGQSSVRLDLQEKQKKQERGEEEEELRPTLTGVTLSKARRK